MCLTPRSYTIISTNSVGLLPEVEMEVIRERELAIEYFNCERDGAEYLPVLVIVVG